MLRKTMRRCVSSLTAGRWVSCDVGQSPNTSTAVFAADLHVLGSIDDHCYSHKCDPSCNPPDVTQPSSSTTVTDYSRLSRIGLSKSHCCADAPHAHDLSAQNLRWLLLHLHMHPCFHFHLKTFQVGLGNTLYVHPCECPWLQMAGEPGRRFLGGAVPNLVAKMRVRGVVMDIRSGDIFPAVFSDPAAPGLSLRRLAVFRNAVRDAYNQESNYYYLAIGKKGSDLIEWIPPRKWLSDLEAVLLTSTTPLSEDLSFLRQHHRAEKFYAAFPGGLEQYTNVLSMEEASPKDFHGLRILEWHRIP
eukprot:GHVQ01009893.1.p1 GENE.GHVQ01009893.1~~GHVQ01009893.1.p1  ORF type:complete len:301 (-),score=29.18 GHVQ01009893.1:2089-2991(-)